MGTTAVLLQAGLTAAMLGIFVLAGRLADTLLSGDPRLPRSGHRAVTLAHTEGSDMSMEYVARALMAERMRQAESYRRGMPQSPRRHGRHRRALRRLVGQGLVRAGLRLVGTPVPSLTREGARP